MATPKSATCSTTIIIIFLAALAVTTLASSAVAADEGHSHSGCPGSSVPEILEHYGFPGGLFPNDVKHFSCEPDSRNSSALRLKIQLYGTCDVTKTFIVTNVVECAPEISATVSEARLSDVSGVTVALYLAIIPISPTLTVTDVVVRDGTLQFRSAQGVPSPVFQLSSFPKDPPNCDNRRRLSGGSDIVDSDVPSWAFKNGRLLPLVAGY